MSVVSRIIKKGTRMMSKQRVYLIVLDSFGIGHAPDAADFGDEGANTLYTITHSKEYDTPNMRKLHPNRTYGNGWITNKMKEKIPKSDVLFLFWG